MNSNQTHTYINPVIIYFQFARIKSETEREGEGVEGVIERQTEWVKGREGELVRQGEIMIERSDRERYWDRKQKE